MIPRRRMLSLLPAVAGVGLAAGSLAGCGGPPAKYYRVIPVPGRSFQSRPAIIRVRDISVPAYLGGSGIAQPSGTYEYAASGDDLWAEPLAEMLQSVLVQNLTQRLPKMTVTSANGTIGAPADYTVEINVLRFDPDASRQITLIAQTGLKQADGSFLSTRTLQSSAMPAAADVPGMMAAMSKLWAGLADAVAMEISQ